MIFRHTGYKGPADDVRLFENLADWATVYTHKYNTEEGPRRIWTLRQYLMHNSRRLYYGFLDRKAEKILAAEIKEALAGMGIRE